MYSEEIEVLVDLKPFNESLCQQNSVIRVARHLLSSQFANKIVSSFSEILSNALPNGFGYISISKCHPKFNRFVLVKSSDQDFLEDGDKFEVDLRTDEPHPKDMHFLFPVILAKDDECVLKLEESKVKFQSQPLSIPLKNAKPGGVVSSFDKEKVTIKEEPEYEEPVYTPVQPSGVYQPAVKYQQDLQQQPPKVGRFDLSMMGSKRRINDDRRDNQPKKRFVSSLPSHSLDHTKPMRSARNFSRSEEAGLKKCHNCGGRGHIAIQCPSERESCFNCGEKGHFSRECLRPVKCHKCRSFGHLAVDCPETLKCYNCNESGHLRAQCNVQERRCFNCREIDHLSRDCPHPTMCTACGELGHLSKSCTNRLAKLRK